MFGIDRDSVRWWVDDLGHRLLPVRLHRALLGRLCDRLERDLLDLEVEWFDLFGEQIQVDRPRLARTQ